MKTRARHIRPDGTVVPLRILSAAERHRLRHPRKASPGAVSVPVRVALGRKLWKLIHMAGLTGPVTKGWLERRILPSLRALNCGCSDDFVAWVRAHPPPEGNGFEWTVEMHNAVNARLKKKVLTVEEAHAVWSAFVPTV
jgi:hypothetical protein